MTVPSSQQHHLPSSQGSGRCRSALASRPRRPAHGTGGFTLIELLVVISIILVLAGLVLSVTGMVRRKAAEATINTQMASLTGALESYNADYGVYPYGGEPPSFGIPDPEGSELLYKELTGDLDADGVIAGAEKDRKAYIEVPQSMRGGTTGQYYFQDPFGTTYGYFGPDHGSTTDFDTDGKQLRGYNPDFDLWSTVGRNNLATTEEANNQWITNWR